MKRISLENKRLLRLCGILILSVALFFVYRWLFGLFFATDVETQLTLQNRLYRKNLPYVERNVEMLENEIRFLQDRDARIYVKVFNVEAPLLDEIIDADILCEAPDEGDMTRMTYVHSGSAMFRSEGIEENWKAVFSKLNDRNFVLPPLETPVAGITHKSVGASSGEKLNPFYKVNVRHDGIDIIAPEGTPVLATSAGTVSSVAHRTGGSGIMVELTHRNGYVTRYAHLQSTELKKGQFVRKSAEVGKVGDSGRAFTTHLHYELLYQGKVMDPAYFFCGSVDPEEYLNILIMSSSSGQSMD